MTIKPILFGCEGPRLLPEERNFFKVTQPFGFILFKRNIETPAQVRALVVSLREAVGRLDAPVFIDQEGGPVARLKPPHWPELPPMRTIGALFEKDRAKGEKAAALHARIIAHMLIDLGINGNFAPVLDLFLDGATSAIGQRAISDEPAVVASVGHIVLNAFMDNGVMPVIKHMPGHGRALVDPHLTLPIVESSYEQLAKEDFEPFKLLRHAPCGMNCHVVFKSLDADYPVSLSKKVHREIIRGVIGFEGIVFSDDLAMKALNGSLDRIANQALDAGADILLYCPGLRPEMSQIAAVLPSMSAQTERRWKRAQAMVKQPTVKCNIEEDTKHLYELIKE